MKEGTLRIHRLPHRVHVEKLKEKGVTDSEEDCTRGGQARHEDYFLLEGRTVRVLGGTTLEGSGEDFS